MTLLEARAIVIDLSYERADLGILLEASKATNDYRPFIVAAYTLATAKNTKRLTKAGEVSFSEATRDAVNNLLMLQSAADTTLIGIPVAWTVEAFRMAVLTQAPQTPTYTAVSSQVVF